MTTIPTHARNGMKLTEREREVLGAVAIVGTSPAKIADHIRATRFDPDYVGIIVRRLRSFGLIARSEVA